MSSIRLPFPSFGFTPKLTQAATRRVRRWVRLLGDGGVAKRTGKQRLGGGKHVDPHVARPAVGALERADRALDGVEHVAQPRPGPLLSQRESALRSDAQASEREREERREAGRCV